MTTTLVVEGMTCGHCKDSVERALLSLPEVERATVDVDAKTATVDHSVPIDEAALAEAVASAGYSVGDIER